MSEFPEDHVVPVAKWLAAPLEAECGQVIERISRAEDVVRIAVMPDVHVAGDTCVGTAMATRRLIYPTAVGGDIGCGMLAVAFDALADIIREPAGAGKVLHQLGQKIPPLRRNRSRTLSLPPELSLSELSHPSLRSLAEDEGRLQLGTLGGGNHFIELQADESDQLWLMIHSGSRAIGQNVKFHHLANAKIHGSLRALDADSPEGQSYLADQNWARRYADANRRAMLLLVIEVLHDLFKIDPIESTVIACDHNHVRREEHFGESLLIHRKGTMPAESGMPGVVPGSMGTLSYHVEGRGCVDSLMSSAHGAGRLFSRHAARERFSLASLRQQMQNVWFDPRLSDKLREESPKSYKDVQAVMRAQRDLVKITRVLRPLLVYKGR